MNNTINLLIHEKTPSSSGTKGLLLFRRLAIGSFALTLLISIGFLLLIIFSPLPGLIQEKNMLVSQISQEKFVTMLSLSDRLRNISGVIAKRPAYISVLDTLQQQLPDGAQMQSVKMTGQAITFGVSSSSLGAIDQFLAKIKSRNEEGTRLFRTMSLTNLTYNNQQNSYVLTVDMTLL